MTKFVRLFFFHITVHFEKPSIGIGIENINTYRNNSNIFNHIIVFLPSIFKNSKEEIYQLIISRLVKLEKRGKRAMKDLGVVPYWIENLSDKIKVYDTIFYRVIGPIYFMKEKNTKGLIIFNKQGVEFFCVHRVKKKMAPQKDFLLIIINIFPFKCSRRKI
jgi:hypothetical protein